MLNISGYPSLLLSGPEKHMNHSGEKSHNCTDCGNSLDQCGHLKIHPQVCTMRQLIKFGLKFEKALYWSNIGGTAQKWVISLCTMHRLALKRDCDFIFCDVHHLSRIMLLEVAWKTRLLLLRLKAWQNDFFAICTVRIIIFQRVYDHMIMLVVRCTR